MSAIVYKSEDLAVRIVRMSQYLADKKQERVMSRQLLRSGTSIGANIAEAHSAQSDADFIAKMHIALKECNETRYWCRILKRTEFISEEEFQSISFDIDEIYSMLTAIIKTTKARLEKK